MTSRVIAAPRSANVAWTSRVDAVRRLIGWLRPSTTGRSQALARLEQLKRAVVNGEPFSMTLSQLSHDLDEVYPGGAIVTLARRQVRAMLLALNGQR